MTDSFMIFGDSELNLFWKHAGTTNQNLVHSGNRAALKQDRYGAAVWAGEPRKYAAAGHRHGCEGPSVAVVCGCPRRTGARVCGNHRDHQLSVVLKYHHFQIATQSVPIDTLAHAPHHDHTTHKNQKYEHLWLDCK